MPSPPDIVQTADAAETAVAALRFLGDANRVRILRALAQDEACVSELTDTLAIPQSLASYHLRRLREAGLVRSRRDAHRVYYALDAMAWNAFAQPIRDLCAIVDLVSQEAAAADPDGENGHRATHAQ